MDYGRRREVDRGLREREWEMKRGERGKKCKEGGIRKKKWKEGRRLLERCEEK